MFRDLICKKCLKVVGNEETKNTTKPKKVKLCTECKNKYIEELRIKTIERNRSESMSKSNSERMKNNNPMFTQETRERVSNTNKKAYASGERISAFQNPDKLKDIKSKWRISDKGRSKISQQMKHNNPMKNLDSKNKMIDTFKKRIQTGEIKYKKGKDHHLWKGNRGFCDTLRTQLYPVWTFKCLERDNFQCVNCCNTKDLTVHHIKPLRDIVNEVLRKYNITNFSLINRDNWQFYFDEIIGIHLIDDGITLCKQCHAYIDKFYHYKQ